MDRREEAEEVAELERLQAQIAELSGRKDKGKCRATGENPLEDLREKHKKRRQE